VVTLQVPFLIAPQTLSDNKKDETYPNGIRFSDEMTFRAAEHVCKGQRAKLPCTGGVIEHECDSSKVNVWHDAINNNIISNIIF
jgi:hypothetical protein